MTDLQTQQAEAIDFASKAEQLLVIDADSYAHAGEIVKQIKGIRKAIFNTFKPMKQKIDASKKEVLDQERKLDNPLKAADVALKGRMADWQTEEEARRQEKQAALRLVAQKRDEDLRVELAMQAEAAGDEAQADYILEAPPLPPPVVASRVPKVDGLHTRDHWRFEITDPEQVPRLYWEIDEAAIGDTVRRMKSLATIPGVRVWCEKRWTDRS